MTAHDPTNRIMTSLRVRLPGATDGLIRHELFNVIDEFFRETDWWRETLTIVLNNVSNDYPLVPPSGSEIVRVLSVTHNEIPLTPAASSSGGTTLRGRINADTITPDSLSFDPSAVVTDSGGVFAYSLFLPDYITLSGLPTEVDTTHPLAIRTSLTIDPLALERVPSDWGLDPFFWRRLYQMMKDGALGNMMSMIAKPWSSERMAIYHLKRFNNWKSQLRVEADRGPVKDVPTWGFPTNFA